MSKEDTGFGSGGLLSKVVKFVKSPTTHWADLDRPEADQGESESRLALKEMIERKRRNDFVRNREFDMLRKVRRRESLKEGESAAGGPSFYPSSQPANNTERARTLKKIDEIEAQMSTAWFKRHGGGAAPGEASPGAPSPHAYDKTDPMPLAERAAPDGAETSPAPMAFAPTLTLDQVVMPTAPAPWVEQPRAPTSTGAHLLGEVPEFNVEVLAAARQDPEVEEAAIRFANGDAAGAEAVLLDLVAEGGSRGDDVDTWLTLFDLYRCVGDQTKFDDATFEFAARFGRSAPQWALISEPSSAPTPIAPAAAGRGSGPFSWTCPSTMGTQSVAALRATLARQASPWCIDWRYVKAIEPAALPALIEELKRWAETPARFKFLGVERLLDLLTQQSPTDDRSADPLWWEARLALLRVLGDMDEFELAALNFCVTYEVSPPAWEAPKNRCSAMTEEGDTVPPSQFDPTDLPGASQSFVPTDLPPRDAATDGVVKTALEGEYLGAADAVLGPLIAQTEASAYELNCRQLLRVDFGAAGDLLNWSMEQQTIGRPVTFKQVNRLVAAFFGVIGITDAARVVLRTD